VFPARYELNSYIVFRKRLVSKRLNRSDFCDVCVIWSGIVCTALPLIFIPAAGNKEYRATRFSLRKDVETSKEFHISFLELIITVRKVVLKHCISARHF
jgi:hypothetical protein